MTIRRIAVFDFDGTLFRSPERPEWWPHQGFWGRMETLSEPLVPAAPGPEWYVEEVVQAALEAQASIGTRTVLVTGRIPKFTERVLALLGNAGVVPDESHFTLGSSTLPFKVSVLEGLMNAHPRATVVELWDDREEHLETFRSTVEQMGRVAVIHHVGSTPMEFLRTA